MFFAHFFFEGVICSQFFFFLATKKKKKKKKEKNWARRIGLCDKKESTYVRGFVRQAFFFSWPNIVILPKTF